MDERTERTVCRVAAYLDPEYGTGLVVILSLIRNDFNFSSFRPIINFRNCGLPTQSILKNQTISIAVAGTTAVVFCDVQRAFAVGDENRTSSPPFAGS